MKKEFPAFETQRLILREFSHQDKDIIHDIRSNPSMMKYMNRPLHKNLQETIDFIDNSIRGFYDSTGINWSIEMKDSGIAAGYIGLWRIDRDNNIGETGFAIHPDFRGKKIIGEAMLPVIEYGFNREKLNKIIADVDPENIPCRRILEKHNFTAEAHLRDNIFFLSKYFDSIIYGLLKRDWKQL